MPMGEACNGGVCVSVCLQAMVSRLDFLEGNEGTDMFMLTTATCSILGFDFFCSMCFRALCVWCSSSTRGEVGLRRTQSISLLR